MVPQALACGWSFYILARIGPDLYQGNEFSRAESGAFGPRALQKRQLPAKSFPDGERSVSNRNRGAIRKDHLHPRGCLLFPHSRGSALRAMNLAACFPVKRPP
jgi:hypothetical protein